jgi:hypothetical protein
MISLRKWFDGFRGAGDAAVTVPSMDGALRPNNLLDRASVVWRGRDATVANLTTDGVRHFFSCGAEIFAIGEDLSAPERLAECGGLVTALAAHHSGKIAVGVSGKGILILSPNGELEPIAAGALNCPTAIAFENSETVIVANGSESNAPEKWCRDLMEKNRSGTIWRIDVRSGDAKCMARDLGYPAGVAFTSAGDIIVSESWRHQLLVMRPGAEPIVALEDLPGYPGGIVRGTDGYWLSVFAPRRQLIEFVLREDRYRNAMLATLDEGHWVAPALKTGVDYFEPVQGGGVRHLGIVKPWAPTRSYGLVVHLDDEFNPRVSYHSRAGANRHGITSIAERGDRVLATCAATNELLAFDPNITED